MAETLSRKLNRNTQSIKEEEEEEEEEKEEEEEDAEANNMRINTPNGSKQHAHQDPRNIPNQQQANPRTPTPNIPKTTKEDNMKIIKYNLIPRAQKPNMQQKTSTRMLTVFLLGPGSGPTRPVANRGSWK